MTTAQINNISYRSFDGAFDYQFTFTFVGGHEGWRVYIGRQPDYGGRSTDAHSTHRLGIGSRPYVCWAGRLETLGDAKAVAALWADCTQNYLRHGSFAVPAGRPPIGDRSNTVHLDTWQPTAANAQTPSHHSSSILSRLRERFS